MSHDFWPYGKKNPAHKREKKQTKKWRKKFTNNPTGKTYSANKEKSPTNKLIISKIFKTMHYL